MRRLLRGRKYHREVSKLISVPTLNTWAGAQVLEQAEEAGRREAAALVMTCTRVVYKYMVVGIESGTSRMHGYVHLCSILVLLNRPSAGVEPCSTAQNCSRYCKDEERKKTQDSQEKGDDGRNLNV